MLDQLLHLDRVLFLSLNNLGSESWDGFWLAVTNKWTSIPVYLILLIISYRFLGIKKTLLLLVCVGLLITCTDQLANFFKYGVRRLRPCHEEDLIGKMRLVKAYCGGKFAFFSAHAANSFALASFFIFLLKKRINYFAILILLWALLVAYSRIYIGVHYPLDVLTGLLIGSLFGWLFYKLYIFALQKFSV